MAQPNSGDWPITASETTGNDLADKLNRLTAAQYSGFSGTSRPPNVKAGMIWAKQESSQYALMLYNGSSDTEIASSTNSGVAVFDNMYTKSQVDSKISGLQNQINSFDPIPAGIITLWKGTSSTIPSGWRLCNGSNGTPNLRDRFVVGAEGSYSVGNTGGQDSINKVPSHSHTFSATTNSAGNHDHGGDTGYDGKHNHQWWSGSTGDSTLDSIDTGRYGGMGDARFWNSSGSMSYFNSNSTARVRQDLYTGGARTLSVGNSHRHSISSSGSHSHSVSGSTNNSGNSSVDIRPKYYALCYIMKT